MTELLDRLTIDPSPSCPDVARPVAARAAERVEPSPTISVPVAWSLAALSIGAGAIHLVMAPVHAAESVEGFAFLAAGWVQVGLAAGVIASRSGRRDGPGTGRARLWAFV